MTQADSTDVRTNIDGDRAQVTGIYHTTGTDKDGKADKEIVIADGGLNLT